jgi:hypothetical protein
MKYLKMLGLAAVAAMALTAFVASTASATTLEVKGVKQTGAVTIKATLEPGTSAVLKDELGSTTDTCTGSTVEGKTEESETTKFTGAHVGGKISTLDFTGCSHTTDVLANGSLSVTWIKPVKETDPKTNGTVSSANAEVRVQSTFFGISAICKTGAGTDIGTLTGKASGQATMDINATLDCGSLGKGFWTGLYLVTSPEGLGVVE